MTKKCHFRPQTLPRQREDETQNADSHISARTQLRWSNQPPFLSEMIAKLERH